MEEITHHFGVGASGGSGHGPGQQQQHHHHHHHLWGSSLSAVVAPPPQPPPSAGLPLTLNTAAAGNSCGAGGNPVLQLANGGGLLDACVKAKEPSSSSPYAGDVEAIKAKIISHPHYYSLLAAYLECQKASSCLTTVESLLLLLLLLPVLLEKFLLHLMSCVARMHTFLLAFA
jgi:homeobox protein Meis2